MIIDCVLVLPICGIVEVATGVFTLTVGFCDPLTNNGLLLLDGGVFIALPNTASANVCTLVVETSLSASTINVLLKRFCKSSFFFRCSSLFDGGGTGFGDGLVLGDGLGELLGDGLGNGLGDGLGDGLGEGLGLDDGDGLGDGLGLFDGEELGDKLGLGEGLWLGDVLGDVLGD